jgi:hypothetical protein
MRLCGYYLVEHKCMQHALKPPFAPFLQLPFRLGAARSGEWGWGKPDYRPQESKTVRAGWLSVVVAETVARRGLLPGLFPNVLMSVLLGVLPGISL